MADEQKVIIWGAAGHALVVADIMRLVSYKVVGFIDDLNSERHKAEFCGSVILGGREQLESLRKQNLDQLIFGFGDCQARLKLSDIARQEGFRLARAIHPRSVVAMDVMVGDGTVIAAGAVVNPASSIGENVIINTNASIDHECVIADGAHVGPGVCLGGRVLVGRGSWIGIGAVVKDKLCIGSNSIVGAGAVVLNDIPDNVVAYGSPAQVIRRNQ